MNRKEASKLNGYFLIRGNKSPSPETILDWQQDNKMVAINVPPRRGNERKKLRKKFDSVKAVKWNCPGY